MSDAVTPTVIPESEVDISAMRAQGAGGQNVNKVSSAIHLRFDIPKSSLADDHKAPSSSSPWKTAKRSRASCSLRWKWMGLNTSVWRSPRPALTAPCATSRILCVLKVRVIDITLKAPMGAAAGGQVNANRKKFRGTLERAESGGWQIVWSDEPAGQAWSENQQETRASALAGAGFCWMSLRMRVWRPLWISRAGGEAGQVPGRVAGWFGGMGWCCWQCACG
jgi:hypothetical protein